MSSEIREIFAEECAHVKIDKLFFRKLCDIESGFVNKKQEHIEFFGGTLTGVQVVRFTDSDFDKVFTDLLEVDERALEDRVHGIAVIDPDWKISRDIFNVSCVWIMHAIDQSPYLDDKHKEEAKIRIALYLNYRFLTSILFRFFKYPANPETAAATYAQLSYRYLLKAKGSWGAALRSRSEDVISSSSIHFNTIKRLDDDYEVVKMLNDVQGRIKDIIKNIYSVFIKVHEQGSKIASSSSMVETDGVKILKDKTKSMAVYTRYLKTIISDKHSFIRQELFEVITSVVHTAPPHHLKTTLEWVSGNYAYVKDDSIQKTIDAIMEHALQYLSENKSLLKQKDDIIGILAKLRGAYTSSRSTEVKLMEIKKRVESTVAIATNSKNESTLSAVRTAFCLYVILRAFTMNHYQSR